MNPPSRSLLFSSLAVVALAAMTLVPVRGRAGSPAPTTAPPISTQGRPAALIPQRQDGSSSAIPTIRAYSNLVVVDIVVNDSHGNPIHGLKASNFSLTENNKLQSIRNFEEHSEVPATDIKLEDQPKLPPGLFSNKQPAPENGPVNVLLLDYLNTPMSAQPFLRAQLREFLDKAPPGTRMAIFTLNTQLQMMQGFTSDMSALKTALASAKGMPDLSHIQQGKDTSLNYLQQNQPQEVQDAVTRMEALGASDRRNMQALYTLNAFDMLARYLVGIPGRKNVIWYSQGFPLDVEPDLHEEDPNDSVVRNDDAVRRTDNLLTRAQIAVYPVDVRGVQGDPALDFRSPIMDARMQAAINAAEIAQTGGDPSKANDAVYDASAMASLQEKSQEEETMMAVAEDTGGEAFVNTNSLAQAAIRAIEHGSNYYTLTYAPANLQWDARFRTIKVKLDQPGAKLIYRNGYYAVDPDSRNKLDAAGAATALSQRNTMTAAMIHGGPDATQIAFKVRIRPSDTPPSATPLAANRTNPDPRVKVEGPYKYYGVDLVPDPKAVSCQQEPNGDRHCAIEVWTYVYDSDGQLLVTTGNRLFTLLHPTDYQKLLSGGMAFHQEISVPVKGEHYLRTAIHDMVSDRIGAVEVPVTAVAKLDPLKPLPALPAPAATTFTPGGDTATTPAATEGTASTAGAASPAAPTASVPVTGTSTVPSLQSTNPTLKRRSDPSPTPQH